METLYRLYFTHCSIRWTKLVKAMDYDRCAMCERCVHAYRVESESYPTAGPATDDQTQR